MKNTTPLISIITATYNASEELGRTIESLVGQTYKNVQYIIIDGGSRDNTREVVGKFRSHVDVFVSERDEGIGDAWNKGIALAKGEFICLLNAGDEYAPDFLENHVKLAAADAINYGITYMTDENMVVIKKNDKTFNPDAAKYGFGFMHTSCFVPKVIYDEVGPFNKSYKIAVDTEWLIRAQKKGFRFQKTQSQNFMQVGGVSEKRYLKAQSEYSRALREANLISGLGVIGLRIRALLFLTARDLKVLPLLRRVRMEVLHMGLAFVNTLLAVIPFWSVRKLVLRLSGVKVGAKSTVHRGVKLFSIGRVQIGQNTIVNRGVYLDNRANINIGNHVSIAHDVKIYTTGHDANDYHFSGVSKSVSIGDYAVIYAGAYLMPGIEIGKAAIIYPGSVVSRTVGPGDIVAGNPATVVGQRKIQPKYELYHPYWYAN